MVCIINSMPCNDCSALHGVNPNLKKSIENSSAQKPIAAVSISPSGNKLIENPVLNKQQYS